MRGLLLFVFGVAIGLLVQAAIAQNQNPGVIGLNHVALSVPNVDEAVRYYTQTMGFSEAFRVTDSNGQPTIVYVQISKNTFVELQPATPQRAPGFNHFGLHVENIETAAAMFKQRGASVSDINRGSQTKAILANITDPNGIRIELAELPPGSMHRLAIDRWK